MPTASHLGRVQQRVAWIAVAGAVVVTVAAVAGAAAAVSAARRAVPVLDGEGGALAEALQWPWQGFPPVAPVERATISREFRLDEPLFHRRVLPWTELPDAAALRPWGAAARRDVAEALAQVRPLRDPRWPEAFALQAAEPDPARFENTIRALGRADPGDGSWITRYDRGVLRLWQESHRAAERELEAAMAHLRPHLPVPAGSEATRAEVLSAAVHTAYALGHALSRGGEGEPEDVRQARRERAIRQFRDATILAAELARQAPDLYGVDHALAFFRLRPTGLSTGAVANDLVAAYLAAPEFHDCEARPSGWPCDDPPPRGQTCSYRDRVLCASVQRAEAPFGSPYVELLHRFYRGEAWEEEHLLWALSNAVDRDAENFRIDDPYLLYNFGSMLVQVGELEAAAELLDRALDAVRDETPADDLERIERLATVGQVLAGRSPRGAAGGEERVSTYRAAYRRLYPDPDALPVAEFPPVGGAFEPDAEAMIDEWLFVQLWRAQIAAGDVEAFDREFDRLMAEDDLPRDFFVTWRREVMGRLGERALERAAAYEAAGEDDRAALIRRFVSDSGHFPGPIARQARGVLGWLGFLARRLAVPLALAAAAAAVVAAWVVALGTLRAHRRLFLSAYRRERHGAAAYPAAEGR